MLPPRECEATAAAEDVKQQLVLCFPLVTAFLPASGLPVLDLRLLESLTPNPGCDDDDDMVIFMFKFILWKR